MANNLVLPEKNRKSPIFHYKIFLLKEIHLYLRFFKKKKRMKSSFLRSDLDTSCYHWPLDFRHKASSPQEAPPVGLDWGQAWGIHGGWVPWIQDDVFSLWYLFKWCLVYLLICLICQFISIYHLSSYLSTVYCIYIYIDLYVCFVGGGLLVWSCRFQGGSYWILGTLPCKNSVPLSYFTVRVGYTWCEKRDSLPIAGTWRYPEAS